MVLVASDAFLNCLSIDTPTQMSEQHTHLPPAEPISIEWLEETIESIETQQNQLQQAIAYEQRTESDEETKKEIRKLSNRVSAARSRQRTRARLQELEEMVRQLAIKNITLKQTLATLLSERAHAAGFSRSAASQVSCCD